MRAAFWVRRILPRAGLVALGTILAQPALAEEGPQGASEGPPAALPHAGAPSPSVPPGASAPPSPNQLVPPPAPSPSPATPKSPKKTAAGSPALPLVAQGNGQMLARDSRGACASYQEASALDPRSPTPLLRLTECSLALGELDEALRFSELAIRVSPPEGRARLAALARQAAVFEARGDLDKALSAYERISVEVTQATKNEDRVLFDKLARERSRAIETRKKELEASGRVRARVEQELKDAAPKSGGKP